MKARIYPVSKNPMQSGRGKAGRWALEFEQTGRRGPEPLMGWTRAEGTAGQVVMRFETREDAVSYAERAGLDYTLQSPRARKLRPRNYSDNFKYTPPGETPGDQAGQ
jgi:hypothetical protein